MQRNLRIFFAMSYQKWHLDTVENAVEVHVRGNRHEFLDVFSTPDPADMFPVMRYRETSLPQQALFLYIPPIMVGAPNDAHGEARLEGHCTRTIVSAQRNPLEANAFGIDIAARFKIVEHL